ncbi:MAG: DUF4386 family protein [Candidatus Hermodarchaeota archaeon]
MNVDMMVSGFLFLLILVLQVIMALFGYILEPTPKHYESDAKLLKFNNSPKGFQLSVVFALIEHFCVITLAIMLFFAFSLFNIILCIIIVIFRVTEGAIQVYIEKDYWRLLNIAKSYSTAEGKEKDSLFDSYRNILQTKSSRFAFVMVCWSIGTFAFSLVLVTYGTAPLFIGWLGIAASITVGILNVTKLLKISFKAYEIMSSIVGLVSIVFELLIGVWLLFFS